MTTLTIPARDSATMLGREFKHTVRFPLLLVGSILVPVVLLLLFVYILGGPIGHGLGDAARGAPYIDFLVPGILVITVAAGSGTTAINVCTDMTGGIFDRFRTMAVSRGALLTGHVGGYVLRTLVTTTVVTGVALLVGFRAQASVADWFAVAGLVAAFSFALAWLSAALGLVAKSVAGANGSTLPIQFLLPFLSSAFVPVALMPHTAAGPGPGHRPAGHHAGRRVVAGLGPAHRDRQAAPRGPVKRRGACAKPVAGAVRASPGKLAGPPVGGTLLAASVGPRMYQVRRWPLRAR